MFKGVVPQIIKDQALAVLKLAHFLKRRFLFKNSIYHPLASAAAG